MTGTVTSFSGCSCSFHLYNLGSRSVLSLGSSTNFLLPLFCGFKLLSVRPSRSQVCWFLSVLAFFLSCPPSYALSRHFSGFRLLVLSACFLYTIRSASSRKFLQVLLANKTALPFISWERCISGEFYEIVV